ncbi:PGPGW domain-containing protein [Glaciecola sp. 33A]|uniref:PGPGW domain-containing protein n=1 Tax=Glaciecola sp. 33A TaxID=2057807 RepID=UPI000C33C7F4|nr:PGPGW domain-containing protein [Glaciecola sp. 33A]PKI02191.1 tellurium resistance protein TerC [Glaciecola sp. 33A]
MRLFRTFISIVLILFGVIFSILPGSILFVLGGLMLLSIDFPPAKRFLSKVQRAMSRNAKKLDLFVLNRKYK